MGALGAISNPWTWHLTYNYAILYYIYWTMSYIGVVTVSSDKKNHELWSHSSSRMCGWYGFIRTVGFHPHIYHVCNGWFDVVCMCNMQVDRHTWTPCKVGFIHDVVYWYKEDEPIYKQHSHKLLLFQAGYIAWKKFKKLSISLKNFQESTKQIFKI